LVVLCPSLVSSSSATIFLWLLGSVQWSRCNLGIDSPILSRSTPLHNYLSCIPLPLATPN
jgi:hypothetical protein